MVVSVEWEVVGQVSLSRFCAVFVQRCGDDGLPSPFLFSLRFVFFCIIYYYFFGLVNSSLGNPTCSLFFAEVVDDDVMLLCGSTSLFFFTLRCMHTSPCRLCTRSCAVRNFGMMAKEGQRNRFAALVLRVCLNGWRDEMVIKNKRGGKDEVPYLYLCSLWKVIVIPQILLRNSLITFLFFYAYLFIFLFFLFCFLLLFLHSFSLTTMPCKTHTFVTPVFVFYFSFYSSSSLARMWVPMARCDEMLYLKLYRQLWVSAYMLSMMMNSQRKDEDQHQDPNAATPTSHGAPAAVSSSRSDDESPFQFRRPLVARQQLVPPLSSPRAPMSSLPRNAAPTSLLGSKPALQGPASPAGTAAAASSGTFATPTKFSTTGTALRQPGLATATTTTSRRTGMAAASATTNSGVTPRVRSTSTLLSARSGRLGGALTARSRGSSPTGGVPRPTGLFGASRGPSVVDQLRKKLPTTAYAKYSFDVAKYLREVAQRRQEAVVLRVLPRSHQLMSLVELEQMQRDVMTVEEGNARVSIQNKKADEYNRKLMAQLTAANKARQEALKKQQAEELAAQKALVAENLKATEVEMRARLQLVNQLQPRNAAVTAALAELKQEDSELEVLGQLLEEEKRLQKALKADARFNAAKTAAADGGAAPFWLKQCAASSFNVAAILAGSPLRAAVADNAAVPAKLPAEKRVVVVTHRETGEVLLWAQARTLAAAHEEYGPGAALALLERVRSAGVFPSAAAAAVLWSKEDHAELTKQAKQTEEAAAALPVSAAVLSVQGVSSIPLAAKDVKAMGEAAATA
eukprot:gene7589-5350_t